MEGRNLEQTFFSLESSHGYQMQADCKSNSGSTLVARQSGGGGGSYGSTVSGLAGAADTTITFTNAAPDSTSAEEMFTVSVYLPSFLLGILLFEIRIPGNQQRLVCN